MFGKQDSLPLHGATKRNNGLSNIPVVNQSVALSLVWFIGSVLILLYGISNCRSNAYSYRLDCDQNACVFTTRVDAETILGFDKSDLLEAEYTRIDPIGQLADSQRMKDEPRLSYGHSIMLKARVPVEEGSSMKVEKQLIFSKHDMGRRTARSGASRITRYINSRPGTDKSAGSKKSGRSRRSKSDDKVNLYSGRSVTLLGMTCIVLGFMSCIFACLFGQFSEESKRNRLKKAS